MGFLKKTAKVYGIFCVCVIALMGLASVFGLTDTADDSKGTNNSDSSQGEVLGVQETKSSEATVSSQKSSTPPTDEERAYFFAVDEISNVATNGLNALSEVFAASPYDVFEPGIPRAKAHLAIGIVKKQYENAKELTPPSGYEDIHAELVAGLALWNESMEVTTEVLETQNISDPNANAKIPEGRKLIESAKDKINIKIVE